MFREHTLNGDHSDAHQSTFSHSSKEVIPQMITAISLSVLVMFFVIIVRSGRSAVSFIQHGAVGCTYTLVEIEHAVYEFLTSNGCQLKMLAFRQLLKPALYCN
ncbi:hypothetical protein HW555_009387 [Spodoptera exigua]|uniref:Uncharacterized protein n=1 Tax=Spodoptera exigua TaxID=7107 RepID=A0A835GC43_SPOEX|nr:hypothetical protein HW555_009387 [Spodoptera exigua]